MGLRINQNIAAQNAYRNLSVTDGQMSKSLEKLSSGFRINRAADDAAGLSISEGLRAQIGGMKVAVRNTQDGVSVAQTAEGSLNESTAILQRMRDLAVQASNGGANDEDAKLASAKEMGQLNAELDRIGGTAAFGKSKLLDGSFGVTNKTADSVIAHTNSDGTAGTVGALDTTTTPNVVGTSKPPTDVTAGYQYKLTQVGGQTSINNKPVDITVTVPPIIDPKTGVASLVASPSDIAKAFNSATATALKDAGFQGTELSMSASVTRFGDATYSIGGSGSFTLDTPPTALTDATTGLGLTPAAVAATGNNGKFQVGANASENINVNIGAVNANTLGTSVVDLSANPDGAISTIDNALRSVSDMRASLGAVQNRFEHTINNLNVSVENLSASESRIRDTDVAQEMVSFTRSQILTQAGTSMLSQANQSAQNVLSLLR
jgi:flagellin